MLKTLNGYLLKDLLKVMMLTLVALTLLMSVLAIIRPLRKLGLAGEQLLEVFIYTIPVMLSLTLPIATLFAGTLVYGRFSQDNELLAARASGISTLSLLRPALGLGIVVTIISLVLINVVAPRLSSLSGLVQNNIRQIFFHRIQSRGYADFNRGNDTHVIHADAVDPDANALYGVVYVVQSRKSTSKKKPADPNSPTTANAKKATSSEPGVAMVWAKWASLEFSRDPNGEDEILIRAEDPTMLAGGGVLGQPVGGSKFVEFVMPMENPIKEKTSWYSWTDLVETIKNPQQHVTIRRYMAKVRQSLSAGMLGTEIVANINEGVSYDKLIQGDEQFKIEAQWAEAGKSGASLASAKPGEPAGRLVTVMVRRDNKTVEIVTARDGQITLAWSRMTATPLISIRLVNDVKVSYLGGPGGRRVNRPSEWTRGEIPVPASILTKANSISLTDVYEDPRKITSDKKAIQTIERLRDEKIPKLKSDLMAELHVRLAYGASCFLMVAMGAALGLVFRGGQFISAFALSAVPAAAVIIMLLMGKELVRNPANDDTFGLACIWGGIVLLSVANLVIYARLSRR